MTQNLGSTSNPLSMTGEQWVLEERTDDPLSPEPGECWIRSDLNAGDKIATLKFGDGSEVPIFPTGTSEPGVLEVRRVQTGGQTGYLPVAEPDESRFPQFRLQHDNTVYGLHNNIEPSVIPDSEGLHAHYAARLLTGYSDGETVDPFVDDNGSNDAPATGQPTYRENRINGQPTVEYDGANDYHDTGIVPDTTQPRSVYVVWIVSDDGSNTAYSALDQSGTTDRFYNAYVGSGDVRLGYGDTTSSGGSYPINEFNISTNVYGSGSGEAWIDSTSQHTFNYTGVNDMATSIYIGGRNTDDSLGVPLAGEIAEIVDYQSDHDSQTRQKVWDYLNNIYGVF